MALVYDIFANVFNRKANKKLCDTVTALIRPTDEVLECACGTGLLTGVIAHKRRSRLSPVRGEDPARSGRAEKAEWGSTVA